MPSFFTQLRVSTWIDLDLRVEASRTFHGAWQDLGVSTLSMHRGWMTPPSFSLYIVVKIQPHVISSRYSWIFKQEGAFQIYYLLVQFNVRYEASIYLTQTPEDDLPIEIWGYTLASVQEMPLVAYRVLELAGEDWCILSLFVQTLDSYAPWIGSILSRSLPPYFWIGFNVKLPIRGPSSAVWIAFNLKLPICWLSSAVCRRTFVNMMVCGCCCFST